MRTNGVNLLNDRGVAKIKGIKIPFISGKNYLSLAVIKTDTILPPRSMQIVQFKANATKKNIPFKILPLPTPPYGLVVNTLPEKHNGNLCAVSRNNSDYYIRLRRNTPIGYAVRAEPIIQATSSNRSIKNDKQSNQEDVNTSCANTMVNHEGTVRYVLGNHKMILMPCYSRVHVFQSLTIQTIISKTQRKTLKIKMFLKNQI